MQITLDVAEDIARRLALTPEELSRATLEALALQGARSGKLTTELVRRLLGFSSRYQADGFLKQHEVFYPWTSSDIERDAARALEFCQPCSSLPIPPRSTT